MINRYELERHYRGNGLIARLDDALAKAGLAGKRLSPIDLAPLDQFHTCGLAATVELAEMAARCVRPGMSHLRRGIDIPGRTQRARRQGQLPMRRRTGPAVRGPAFRAGVDPARRHEHRQSDQTLQGGPPCAAPRRTIRHL